MFCPGSGTERAQACVRREGEMNKRKLGSFALSVMLIALGFPVEAQQPKKLPKIGFLSSGGEGSPAWRESFARELGKLGYVEGKNVVFEFRNANTKYERLPALAEELVRLRLT